MTPNLQTFVPLSIFGMKWKKNGKPTFFRCKPVVAQGAAYVAAVNQPNDQAAWSAAFLKRFPDNQSVDVKIEKLVTWSQNIREMVTAYASDVR